jgi:hypothetical protein
VIRPTVPLRTEDRDPEMQPATMPTSVGHAAAVTRFVSRCSKRDMDS